MSTKASVADYQWKSGDFPQYDPKIHAAPVPAVEETRQMLLERAERTKEHWLQKQYGISTAEKRSMLEAQGWKCANPGCNASVSMGGPETHIDHDHVTGKVRGILCRLCNCALGMVRDDRDVLRGLVVYLDRSFTKT